MCGSEAYCYGADVAIYFRDLLQSYELHRFEQKSFRCLGRLWVWFWHNFNPLQKPCRIDFEYFPRCLWRVKALFPEKGLPKNMVGMMRREVRVMVIENTYHLDLRFIVTETDGEDVTGTVSFVIFVLNVEIPV